MEPTEYAEVEYCDVNGWTKTGPLPWDEAREFYEELIRDGVTVLPIVPFDVHP